MNAYFVYLLLLYRYFVIKARQSTVKCFRK